MKEVYVITFSNYNEYFIDSVWSSLELANKRMEDIRKELLNNYRKVLAMREFSRYDIETWEVDNAVKGR